MDLQDPLPAIKALWTKYKKYTKRVVVFLGLANFIVYNFLANEPGQARSLNLPGLKEKVCGDRELKKTGPDHCGDRSLYRDVGWGITAYIEIYGVSTTVEANEIYKFIEHTRRTSRQEGIPVHFTIYALPRSTFNGVMRHSEIFDQRF